MRKRKYPSGKLKERRDKLLEYIRSNPGCMRENIQAYMNSKYDSPLTSKTISEYLADLLWVKLIEEKNGRFFISKLVGEEKQKEKKE